MIDGQVNCLPPGNFTSLHQISNGQVRCVPPTDPGVLNTLPSDWEQPGDLPHEPVLVDAEWCLDGIRFPGEGTTIGGTEGELELPVVDVDSLPEQPIEPADIVQEQHMPAALIEQRNPVSYDNVENAGFSRPGAEKSRVRRLALVWMAVCIIIGAAMLMY